MRYCMILYLKWFWRNRRWNLKLLDLPYENKLFSDFQLWPLITPEPIPYLKALICGYLEPEGLGRGSTFKLYHALVKIGIFLHTEGFVDSHSATTVSYLKSATWLCPEATVNPVTITLVSKRDFILMTIYVLLNRLGRSGRSTGSNRKLADSTDGTSQSNTLKLV